MVSENEKRDYSKTLRWLFDSDIDKLGENWESISFNCKECSTEFDKVELKKVEKEKLPETFHTKYNLESLKKLVGKGENVLLVFYDKKSSEGKEEVINSWCAEIERDEGGITIRNPYSGSYFKFNRHLSIPKDPERLEEKAMLKQNDYKGARFNLKDKVNEVFAKRRYHRRCRSPQVNPLKLVIEKIKKLVKY